MSKVLVIAAHPDDEILGCGGTIARHISEKDKVHVIILAEGVTSRDIARNRKKRLIELKKLHLSSKLAHKIIGTTSLNTFLPCWINNLCQILIIYVLGFQFLLQLKNF